MRLSRIVLLMSVLPCTLWAQTFDVRTVTPLPPVLGESSGILPLSSNEFWSHNDSGNDPALYAFDSAGRLTRTLNLRGAYNLDWEDITRDDSGNLYVGDIGNNLNLRQAMTIYKIPNPRLIKGDTADVQSMYFIYADQTAFPPAAAGQNYDLEAMVWSHDSLFFFTKCRTTPYTGYTRMYAMPAQPADTLFNAPLLDSLLVSGDPNNSRVTSAALSPDGRTLALLTMTKVVFLTGFTGTRFLKGKVAEYRFPVATQKEGIGFLTNCVLYVTDEKVGSIGGNLYKVTICTSGLGTDVTGSVIFGLHINGADRAGSYLSLGLENPDGTPAQIVVTDIEGREVLRREVPAAAVQCTLDTRQLPSGVYWCRAQCGGNRSAALRVVISR